MTLSSTAAVAILFTALGSSGPEVVARDEVDLVEINHFYDENGKHVFDQLIFYDWSAEQSRFQVRAWRLVKSPTQLPQRNWQRGEFEAVWHDGDVLRKIHAFSTRETWTQYDPELIERSSLPREQRRELHKPRAITQTP
jgi:hypothetical protein